MGGTLIEKERKMCCTSLVSFYCGGKITTKSCKKQLFCRKIAFFLEIISWNQ